MSYDEDCRNIAETLAEVLPKASLLGGVTGPAGVQALAISHNTVKLHVRHIMDKLNLRSRVEAAVFSFEYRSSADGIKSIGDGSPRPKPPPH